MDLCESLLPEFDQEMANTRRTLERVPEARFSWKPHEKSGSMVWLAGHLANIPMWTPMTMSASELDIAPGGRPMEQPPEPKTTKELLAAFDKNVTDARAAIAGASDSDFMAAWSLLSNGRMVMTMPRIAVVRSFVLNHMIHHRAQLGVYLRLNDVPVPSIYGPSADENPMGV